MRKTVQKLYGFCAALEARERVKLLILLMASTAALFLRALRVKAAQRAGFGEGVAYEEGLGGD